MPSDFYPKACYHRSMGLERLRSQPPGKAMKLKIYPVAIALLLLGSLILLLGRYQIEVSVEPPPSAVSPPPDPSPTPNPSVPSPQPFSPPPVAAIPGQLRVSNQTSHPVRIALLAKTEQSYNQPVHWDFAPQEGGSQGLILSLPETCVETSDNPCQTGTQIRKIQLGKGDILVAFAQDGSRQYWGPFVVGETTTPLWRSAAQEWLLILKP